MSNDRATGQTGGASWGNSGASSDPHDPRPRRDIQARMSDDGLGSYMRRVDGKDGVNFELLYLDVKARLRAEGLIP